jgi:hypothetical protein
VQLRPVPADQLARNPGTFLINGGVWLDTHDPAGGNADRALQLIVDT